MSELHCKYICNTFKIPVPDCIFYSIEHSWKKNHIVIIRYSLCRVYTLNFVYMCNYVSSNKRFFLKVCFFKNKSVCVLFFFKIVTCFSKHVFSQSIAAVFVIYIQYSKRDNSISSLITAWLLSLNRCDVVSSLYKGVEWQNYYKYGIIRKATCKNTT